jgi:hypothetical protein
MLVRCQGNSADIKSGKEEPPVRDASRLGTTTTTVARMKAPGAEVGHSVETAAFRPILKIAIAEVIIETGHVKSSTTPASP